ncbi:MAG: AraC family transcriptional regulator [Desulfobacterales bacterium]|nr:AraC family transcriptional regulator [Desulfobacterales bacterium]
MGRMLKTQENKKGHTASWHVEGINGLECFRAHNLIHHFRRHSHEGYTIGIVEGGYGDNNYRGSVYHLAPGKIVVMNPDEAHTGYVVSEHPWSYRMLYINEEVFRYTQLENSNLPFFSGLCFENHHWFERLRSLHRLLEAKTDVLEQQSQFIKTLSAFAETFGKTPSVIKTGNEPKAISRIKEFLHAHYKENISIDDLVRITQLSRAYLIRSFQRCVGIPPYAYLIQTRIKHAKVLLTENTPVSQVAYEMGFSDQSHLTRHFKSITGITPKRYAVGHCS